MNPPDRFQAKTLSFDVKVAAGVIFLLPGMANYANRGVAALIAVFGLTMIVVGARRGAFSRNTFRLTPFVPFAAFLAYVLLTALWSIDPWLSLRKFVAVLGLLVAAGVVFSAARVLSAEERQAFRNSFVYGINFLIVLIVLGWVIKTQLLGATPPTDIIRYYLWLKADVAKTSISVLALTLWPLLIIVQGGPIRIAPTIALLSTIAIIATGGSGTAILAVGGGVAVWLLGRFIGVRGGTRVTMVCVAAAIALAPFVADRIDPQRPALLQDNPVSGALSLSAYHRLVIYGFTADKIFERPLLGWGFETTRVIPGGQAKVPFPDINARWVPYDEAGRPQNVTTFVMMPLHPHNFILHWWVELGAIGAAFGLFALLWLLRQLARWSVPPTVGLAALSQFVTWMVLSGAAFGAWQSWWLSSAILSIFLTVIARPHADDA